MSDSKERPLSNSKAVNSAVDKICIAYIARVPIVWLVTPDKEVANDIILKFIDHHLGKKIDPDINDSKKGWAFGLKDNEPGDPSIGTKLHVFHRWFAPIKTEDSKQPAELSEKLEKFLNCHQCLMTEKFFRDNRDSAAPTSIYIVASPNPPAFEWLNAYIETIYVAPPDDKEIRAIINNFPDGEPIFVKDAEKKSKPNLPKLNLKKELISKMVVNLRGLSERMIRCVLTKCVESGHFEKSDKDSEEKVLDEIRRIKRQKLESFRGLKWITVQDDDACAAGLDGITDWLKKRQELFTDTAKSVDNGFDIPKGILVTGIPGTGKSLMAKQAAHILKLPLIALDMGNMQEGIVGKSEEHLEAALRMVDNISPCLLWIDEIEKAFAGAGSSENDGGVMRRMFGKFLTWMQEKSSDCFILATSNDISHLPPEFFRSQRFDEKFFTFMPTAEECADMFCAIIEQQNKKFRQKQKSDIFDELTFTHAGGTGRGREYWLGKLNALSVKEVQLNSEGQWRDGVMPQQKLFTGADIASLVNLLKFEILYHRDAGHKDPIKKTEVDKWFDAVVRDFMPYGETNLKNIANCFRSISQNRFKPASGNAVPIIDFADFREGKYTYHPDYFQGDNNRYNRTLYRCIVGAINKDEKPES